MYLGGLVEEAGADDLYGQPLHPYTRALLSAVPVPDPTIEDTREQILLTGDLPSPSNPPPGCRFHTRCPWRQETRCDDERPPLRVVQIDGVDPSHRVACHWVEQIASGEIRPHEVAPVYVAPGDGDAGAIDDDTFTGPASVTMAERRRRAFGHLGPPAHPATQHGFPCAQHPARWQRCCSLCYQPPPAGRR